MVSTILAHLLPFMTVAAAPAAQTPDIIKTILGFVAGIGGGIVAIFLIVSLVKDAIAFSSGNGSNSIWKIIGKVLFLILMIGLIFLALNYDKLGQTAEGVASNVLNEGTGIIQSVTGGGGGTPAPGGGGANP